MDHLLFEIKNFLKKLKTGQLEIEAGQWVLHKDLAYMKKTIMDMQKLKEDVQEMKLNNEETMGLIRRLKNKIEAYKCKVEELEPKEVSVSTDDYEEIYKMRKDGQDNPKGYKKRKCQRIVSEKVIEISSDVDSNHSEKEEEEESSSEDSSPKLTKKERCTANNKVSRLNHEQKAQTRFYNSYRLKKSKTRKPDGVIMERYLNDAAKYQNRCSSSSSEKKPEAKDSICTSTIRPETKHGVYWDGLNPKKPNKSQQKTVRNSTAEFSEKAKQEESILPKEFSSSTCPENFPFESEFTKHQKFSHENSKRMFYCKTCKKFYDRKCGLKDHLSLQFRKHKSKRSTTAGYKCSYCNKICVSPQQLTGHLKRCRIISKANSKI